MSSSEIGTMSEEQPDHLAEFLRTFENKAYILKLSNSQYEGKQQIVLTGFQTAWIAFLNLESLRQLFTLQTTIISKIN